MTKRFIFLVGATLLAAPVAVSAQTASAPAAATAAKTPTVGATIMDSEGVTIGTVDSITPQAVVVQTGTTKVALPPAAIGATAKGFQLSMTKAALDAAQAQQQQAAAASVQSRLVAGAAVNGINGSPLGTIKTSDGSTVTLTTPNGEAKVPVSGFAPGPNNTIVLGLSAQQLSAMLGGSANAGAATTTPTASATTSTTSTMATDTAPAATTTSDGTAPAAGSATMTSPATPATTTTPTPKMTPTAKATTSTSTKMTTKKKKTRR